MENLSLLQDNINMGYSTIILNILLIISIICAIYIIISKNPIISILYLIGLFISIACYLIIIGLNFIGLSYLLIYIGAVSILFIFILMLINIRISELVSNNINSVPLVIIVSLVLNSVLYNNFPHKNITFNILNYKYDYSLWKNLYQEQIFNVLNVKWDNNIINVNNINSLGNIIYTNFPMLLILASVVLLLGMVGAIVITIKSQSLDPFHKNKNINENKNKKSIKIIYSIFLFIRKHKVMSLLALTIFITVLKPAISGISFLLFGGLIIEFIELFKLDNVTNRPVTYDSELWKDALHSSIPNNNNNPTQTGNNASQAGNNQVPNNNHTGVGGTLRAGRVNGPVVVPDPFFQSYRYDPNTTSQPLARNFGDALDNQRRLGNSTLSRFFCTAEQRDFLVSILRDHNRPLYNRLKPSDNDAPIWWNLTNSIELANTLRNAP